MRTSRRCACAGDERGSSVEAQRILGTHAPDDAVAAAVILQRYLDACSTASATAAT